MDHAHHDSSVPSDGMDMMSASMPSEHGGPPMDMPMDGMQMHSHGKHGSLGGHVLPGSFFIVWALWWLFNIIGIHLNRLTKKKVFKARAWYKFGYWPSFALEPAMKILLPFVGILGELWFSHHWQWRTLYMPDGKLWVDHLNNWQHTVMFMSFIISGLVDLLGSRMPLPANTEQVFLAMAFTVEGTLMAFHIKGTDLDKRIHFLLALIVLFNVFTVLLELAYPQSVLVSIGRCFGVILQGSWFCQAGRILYLGNPAWDDSYMGSVMYLPVTFVLHVLGIACGILVLYVALSWLNNASHTVQRAFALSELVDAQEDSPEVTRNGHGKEAGVYYLANGAEVRV